MEDQSLSASALSVREVDSVVAEIRQVFLRQGLQVAFEIGRLIIERVYGGDLGQWKYKGRKNLSFRKIERHPLLPFTASWLSRAVSVYAIGLRRPELFECCTIGTSHLFEVVALPIHEQDRVLDRAARERWSVRDIRREIAAIRGKPGSNPPINPKSTEVLQRLHGVLFDAGVLETQANDIRELSAHEALELASFLEQVFSKVSQLRAVVTDHLAELSVTNDVDG